MCRWSLWLLSSRFGLWRRERKRNREKHYTEFTESTEYVEKSAGLKTGTYNCREPEWATRGLPESARSMRPMRKNFSRRRFRSASTDLTLAGGTMRIMPTPMLKDCRSSLVSILPSAARNLKMGGTGQEARSI